MVSKSCVSYATGVLLVSFTCCHYVYSHGLPRITQISQKAIKDVGDTADFACTVVDAQDYPILWEKMSKEENVDPVVLSTGTTLVLKNTRFTVWLNDDKSVITLRVAGIQETDAGYYCCQILLGTIEQVSAKVELVVRRAPVISDSSTRSLILAEGETAVLKCNAGGFPIPKISWAREGHAVLPTGGSLLRSNVLLIPNITKEYHGTYYCLAENGVGRSARRSVAVEVLFAPVIVISRPRVSQALQYDVDLECQVEAYPPAAVVWTLNNDILTNNQYYSISQYSMTDEFLETSLHITAIRNRQYGEYVCSAKNILGNANGSVRVYESTIPVCPPACGSQQTPRVKNSSSKIASVNVLCLVFSISFFIF